MKTDWTAQWALYSPHKVALKEYETQRSLTYGRLDAQAGHLARRLEATYGLAPGDRIAVLAEYCLEYVVLFAAAQKAGFVLAPLNYRLAAPELSFILEDSEPALVLWEEKFAATLRQAPAFGQHGATWPLEDLSAWLEALPPAPYEPYPAAALPEDHPMFLLYTSGTTGFPKGAIYTHRMLFWNSVNTAMSLIVNQESRTIVCMPPFHTGGWNVLLTPFLHHGGYVCLMKKFDAPAVLQLLESEAPTLFMGVPTMLKMMADVPGFADTNLASLRYIIVGGEAMPIPLIEVYHAKGVPIRQGYGMTEVGPNLTSLHQDDAIRKKGSIGRPNFYVETRIVDDNGEEAGPDSSGELWLRGPMTTPGYWRNADATARAFSEGNWFRTGDRVRRDAEGYIFVVDRIKNMFISGGENVYPAEVERIILGCEGVAEAAVIGVPDARWGEVGHAYVALAPGAHLNEQTLIDHCARHLAKFKVPRYITFLDALPKNDTGKINRKLLK
jgi:fatty-acyl-CoA synthase